MLERVVEDRLKKLEGFGFAVLKFKTPGSNGTKDRLILMPTWAPAPPAMVEIKRPGKYERPLQAAVRDEWRKRGCDVRDMCNTFEQIDALCETLLVEAVIRFVWYLNNNYSDLPEHIRKEYVSIAAKSMKGTPVWE